MWPTAEWQAVQSGAFRIEQPLVLAVGASLLLALWLWTAYRGPLRVRVPDPGPVRRW